MANNKLYIGTSGWHYKHWIGTFYPAGTKDAQQMAYYMKFFTTVELNNPFYRLPEKSTFENWRKAAPADFIFSVKASRFITHNKKLKDPASSSNLFFDHVKGLKTKLGPILFQLPPAWKVNEERLKAYMEYLPKKYRYTFEFRNATWYQPSVINLLKMYNCAFCIYELDGHLSPIEVTADFVYVRLHGPEGKYAGSYTDGTLTYWANQCKQWLKSKKDVYIYFDNDQAGYAAFNALRLKELLKHS